MLKITRRTGERIMLGEDIVVTLLEISGQTARIGIDAPRAVPVYREEIWVEVKRENEAAAGSGGALPELERANGVAAVSGHAEVKVTGEQ
ncbi:MAG: carbon storage regulator [Solirubrobacteraceae bacterium]|jgi:carbon storage regulator